MALQGFQPRGSLSGDLSEATFPFVVSNGITITCGNAVTLKSGYLENLTVTDPMGVLGVASETVVGNASRTCGVFTDPNMIYYNTTTLATINIDDVGKVMNIASSAGKMYLNNSTGAVNSANQFILLKKDPDGDGSKSKGLWKIYGGLTFNKTLGGLE